MKTFRLYPASTGSTSKSHGSPSLTSLTSLSSTMVTSSFTHAKHATTSVWSVCTHGVRSTWHHGSTAFSKSRRRGKRGNAKTTKSSADGYFSDGSFFPKKSQYRSLGDGAGEDEEVMFASQGSDQGTSETSNFAYSTPTAHVAGGYLVRPSATLIKFDGEEEEEWEDDW